MISKGVSGRVFGHTISHKAIHLSYQYVMEPQAVIIALEIGRERFEFDNQA